jgi:16S rRNA (guanine(966)-N(2))-methyltransferase RsmD
MNIIGGRYKSRVLLSPPGEGTRPITGQVKKSLFGMLGEDLSNMVVLDLYCGTGTLGLESLSRGATHAYFAERNGAVVELLQQNIATLGVGAQATVWNGDVLAGLATWLAEVAAPVDVAFVDPPYATVREWSWDEAIEHIFTPLSAKLDPDGTVVLRFGGETVVPPELGPLKIARTRQYGDMRLALLKVPRMQQTS